MPFGFERREAEDYNKKLLRPDKNFVEIIAWHRLDGRIFPQKLIWVEDNSIYEIDKVIDVTKAASLKSGGMGVRYRVMKMGREKSLFFDLCDNRWFVE